MVGSGAFSRERRRLPRAAARLGVRPTRASVLLFASAAVVPQCAVAQQASPASADAPAQEVAPQAAPASFLIAAIDVSGATKLSAAEIETLIYPFLGPDRTNTDVIAAQKALQAAYAAKGYEAVDVEIPVQPNDMFSQGIVQLAVHEAPLGKVEVVDARHHAAETARAQVPSLVAGQPINIAALQRDVAEANRFPDRQISPKFKPGAVPGTVDVDLQVEDRTPFHASVDLNNDNSPNTRPLRLTGTARYTNLWGAGHTLTVTGSFAPQNRKQSAVVSGSYSAPLIGTPWSILVFGYRSNSNVAALGGTNVLGNGYQIGLRATYKLPGDKLYQQLSFGPDFKSFKESISLLGQPLQPTRIRYVPLVAEYSASGVGERSNFGLTLGATGGLRVVKRDDCFESNFTGAPPPDVLTCPLGNGTGIVADQFTGRAIDASENFVHLNLDFNYTRSLVRDLQIALRLSGQLADSSLVTNEQFSLGGLSNVRGYYLSEAVGDDGVNGSIELRTPDWGPAIGGFVDSVRLFGFVDGGYARVRKPAAGQQRSFRLVGTGGGIRLQIFRLVTGELVVGVPLRRGPISDRGDPRTVFSLKGEF